MQKKDIGGKTIDNIISKTNIHKPFVLRDRAQNICLNLSEVLQYCKFQPLTKTQRKD